MLARSDLFKVQASQARGKIDPAIVTRPGHTCISAFPSGLPSLTLTWDPAYIADGADALATMELKAARVYFEPLGSESHADRMTQLLETAAP